MPKEIQTPHFDIRREESVIAGDNEGPLWRAIEITQIVNETLIEVTTTLLRRDGYLVTTAGSLDQKTFWIGGKSNEPLTPLTSDQVTTERLKIINLIDKAFPLP